MLTLPVSPTRFAAPAPGQPTAIAVGVAFQRALRNRSGPAQGQLRAAVDSLVLKQRLAGSPPEKALIAMKEAIVRFGGMAVFPSLALEHDGEVDDAASLYQLAFAQFLEAYFAVSR